MGQNLECCWPGHVDMRFACVSDVSMNVEMGGGIFKEIANISASEIGPGPDGIFATKPNASAPTLIAI